MWSGPRNISTALMRSWESRPDTYVCDEPFYPHYLAVTGADHPGRARIIHEGETDWRKVARMLTGPVPTGKRIFYQKHMAHHLSPEMAGPWLDHLRHALLIRDPEEMLISLTKVTEHPGLEDTGLPRQVELYERFRSDAAAAPAVIDARDVLENPGPMLQKLCEHLDVPFCDEMLSWDPGPRPTDGTWAPFWYQNVEDSSGFRAYRPPPDPLPSRLAALERECRRYYDVLYKQRLLL